MCVCVGGGWGSLSDYNTSIHADHGDNNDLANNDIYEVMQRN